MSLRCGPRWPCRTEIIDDKGVMRSVSPSAGGAIRFALQRDTMYSSSLQTRGGAVWQLVGLITRRSQVQILPPQPSAVKPDSAVKSYIPAHHYTSSKTGVGKQHQRVRINNSLAGRHRWVTIVEYNLCKLSLILAAQYVQYAHECT